MSTETNSKNKLRHFLLVGLASLRQSIVFWEAYINYETELF